MLRQGGARQVKAHKITGCGSALSSLSQALGDVTVWPQAMQKPWL